MVVASNQEDRIRNLRERLAGLSGRLVVISGPSAGAGKGKVISELTGMDKDLWLSVSMTTRQVRSDDKIHHTYHFVSLEKFEQAEAAGELLEANGVTEGNRYGTPLAPIIQHMSQGQTVLLEIEVHGAAFVHRILPEALYVFIKPTNGGPEEDLAELRRRIEGRRTNDGASVEHRLKQAAGELKLARELGFYNAWVINETGRSAAAAAEIQGLIEQYGHRRLAAS